MGFRPKIPLIQHISKVKKYGPIIWHLKPFRVILGAAKGTYMHIGFRV